MGKPACSTCPLEGPLRKVPKATPLVAMFMLGNLFATSGVVERLEDAAQNDLMNIVTLFLGIVVGSTMRGEAPG